jgi:hypothetical protein
VCNSSEWDSFICRGFSLVKVCDDPTAKALATVLDQGDAFALPDVFHPSQLQLELMPDP